MAEAAAALGLAASILQVTDFGTKFVSTAWKVWRSGRESIDAIASLQTFSQDLRNVIAHLQVESTSPQSDLIVTSDKNIFKAAAECNKEAQEILICLDKILPATSTSRKRDAARTAFRLTWKEDDIMALQARFEGIRSQMILNLAASLRIHATKSLEMQTAILEQLRETRPGSDNQKTRGDQISNMDNGFGSTVVEELAKRQDPWKSAGIETTLRDALMCALYASDTRPLDGFGSLQIMADRSLKLRTQLLHGLCYDEMADRADKVAEAHESTFQWIFDQSEVGRRWASIRAWLESDHQLYWITGKPGSGKSTLMKFISQPPVSRYLGSNTPAGARCLQYLQRWSGNQPLIIASFYFWAAGTKLQTSKEGLYRTLLHQLITQHPDAVQFAFPERWEALCLFHKDPRPFTEKDLQCSLERLLALLSKTTKLCLFIDGLDEFEGNARDLIQLLTRITLGSSVKLCVSSRPWIDFEKAFKNKPSLRMEDLTFNDIKAYVTKRFHEDEIIASKREPELTNNLIEGVVQKACGVFLWVNLAVSSLLDGLHSGDRMCDLQRRLERLPFDLEHLYTKILDDLDPFYFDHAAQYLSLMAACAEPPLAVLFSLADEEDPEFSLQLTAKDWSDADLEARIDDIRRRLNSRCKGLLEVGGARFSSRSHFTTKPYRPTVGYFHKTVKDYIDRPCVQSRLLNGLRNPFDAHQRLSSANLAFLKLLLSPGLDPRRFFEGGERKDNSSRVIKQAMVHAAQVSAPSIPMMVRVLDQVQEVAVSAKLIKSRRQGSPCFSRAVQESEGRRSTLPLESFGNSFLSAAVKCGVLDYIRAKVNRQGTEPRDRLDDQFRAQTSPIQRLRICWATLAKQWARLKFHKSSTLKVSLVDLLLSDAVPVSHPSIDLICFLLEMGADVNACVLRFRANVSLWSRALGSVIICFASGGLNPETKPVLLKMVSLMLSHGAKISRRAIKNAFIAVELFFHISGNLTVTEGEERLRKNLRLYRRRKADLDLDFLSGFSLVKRHLGCEGYIGTFSGA